MKTDLTLSKFLLYCLKKNKKGVFLLIQIILSFFTYIRIITLPTLVAEFNNSSWFFKKFIMYFSIYCISIWGYIYSAATFEQGMQTFIYKYLFKKLLKKQEINERKNIIPNSVYLDISLIVRDSATVLSYFTRIAPNLISMIFVLFYIIKNLNIKIFLLYLIGFIWQISVPFYKKNEILRNSNNLKIEQNRLVNEIQDLNINIDSILSQNNLENEKKNIDDKVKMFDNSLANCINLKIVNIFHIICVGLIYFIVALYSIRHYSSNIIVSFILINISFLVGLILSIEEVFLFFHFIGKLKAVINNISNYVNIELKENNRMDIQLKEIPNTILIKSLKFSYELNSKKNLVIDELYLNLNSIIIFRGHIGAGKSTLLKILFGTLDFQEGIIKISDKILEDKREWRKNFFYGAQKSELFNRSIEENIFYPRTKGSFKEFKIMNDLGLTDIYNELISKEEKLGIGGGKVSGGQKQIIVLLIAIFSEKKFILLDEPTASLDKNLRPTIYKLIKSMKKVKKTPIIATHDNELINIGDQIITFNKGTIE
ncbi:ABC transporter [seawater metagenome]|uniref:ABC transporter n=1 Tax=seawater metagenome TaxID=1561972 RepID=A0A5E8CKA6_9ZZZZ